MVSPMERDDHVLPLTRGQLDIWLAHESGHSGTEWQLGLLIRVEGTVKRDLLERAIRQALQEAEPGRAAFFEVDGQVFQKAIDYSDVELAFHDLSGSDNAEQGLIKCAVAIALHQLLCYFGSLINTTSVQIGQHKGWARRRRAGIGGSYLLEFLEPLPAGAGIDLRCGRIRLKRLVIGR